MKNFCHNCNNDVTYVAKYTISALLQNNYPSKCLYLCVECFTLIAGEEWISALINNSGKDPNEELNVKLQNLQTYDRDSSYSEWYKGEPT